MGKILLNDPDRVIGKYNIPTPILILDNWRAVKEVTDGLRVIINTCERFFLHDLTIQSFHNISNKNETHKRMFKYVENNLVCGLCCGRGILSWIDNITKFVKYKPGVIESYIRDPETPIRELDGYYISSPMVDDGHHLCETCCGTGLHMFNENAYLEMLESERRS